MAAYIGLGMAILEDIEIGQAAHKEGISFEEMELRKEAADYRARSKSACFACSRRRWAARASSCDEQLARFEETRKRKAQEEVVKNGGGRGGFCHQCGAKEEKGVKFCSTCGATVGGSNIGKATVMVTTEEQTDGSKKITTTSTDEYGNRTVNEKFVPVGKGLTMSVNVHNHGTGE